MRVRDRPTAMIAEREIREATRATAFRVTLVISAVALAAIIVVANLGSRGPGTEHVVVSGADAPTRADGVERLGQAAGIDVRVTTSPDDGAARATVDAGDA